jgi:UDP-sulfoquinovose synthase
VKAAGEHLGWDVSIAHIDNPRKELEEHYYNAQHSKLIELGLQPRLLDEELIDTMLKRIAEQRNRIDPAMFVQNVRWAPEPKPGVGSAAGAQRR